MLLAYPYERRRKPRYQGAFPAWIRGIDDCGQTFEEQALVENISACGTYISTRRFFLPNQPISVAIQLGDSFKNTEIGKTYLEIDGTIVRVDARGEERYGVAVDFTHYSFQ